MRLRKYTHLSRDKDRSRKWVQNQTKNKMFDANAQYGRHSTAHLHSAKANAKGNFSLIFVDIQCEHLTGFYIN